MIECKELADKTIRLFTIFGGGHYGPDIQIESINGTRFSACLKTAVPIEATYSRDQGGKSDVLRDYRGPAIPL
jgi:hypothetical protein